MDRSEWQGLRKNNDQYQILLALKENRRKRREYGEILVEGIESIKQALVSERTLLKKLIFSNYEKLSDWGKALADGSRFGEVLQLDEALYGELSDKDEPAELMISLGLPDTSLESVSLPEKPFIVIFDRPSDFGNLGSLIRSANAFGVDLFITHGHCVDLFEPKVIRSSLGAVFHTRIAHEESIDALEEWLGKLKAEKGLSVIGSDSKGDCPIDTRSLARPLALIIGNEAKGMSVRLRQLSDKIVSIPIRGEVNSLNVACAGSILLYSVDVALRKEEK